MTPNQTILIIAGPNGAGKTTFAREFLLNEANCPTFVNADLIAAGLNPLQPEQEAMAAGRMMLNMIDDYVSRGRSFAFETTLSGRGYARMIPRWQEQGYRVRRNCSRLRGRQRFALEIRAWLPLHNRPNSRQIPATLNSYGQAVLLDAAIP